MQSYRETVWFRINRDISKRKTDLETLHRIDEIAHEYEEKYLKPLNPELLSPPTEEESEGDSEGDSDGESESGSDGDSDVDSDADAEGVSDLDAEGEPKGAANKRRRMA